MKIIELRLMSELIMFVKNILCLVVIVHIK